MISEKHGCLAENLNNLRAARNLSLSEFSKELDIPKTTLQSILKKGQTSLYTAIHISEQLSVPLDMLTSGILSPTQIRQLDVFMSQMKWYGNLSREKQEEVFHHIIALIFLIQEGGSEEETTE